MPRIDWRTALRAVLGFLVGLLIWGIFSQPYDSMLASAAEPVMRAFEHLPVTKLDPEGEYVLLDRTDFDPRSKHPSIPVSDLTFNFILLTTLFAADRLSDRNAIGFVLAALAMIVTHVLAVISEVMSVYVLKLGPWSMANYSSLSRNFWSVSNHSYRVVLMYAIAFGLWLLFRDGRKPAERAARAASTSKSRGKAKRRR